MNAGLDLILKSAFGSVEKMLNGKYECLSFQNSSQRTFATII